MADSEVDTMLDGKDEDARSKIADRVGERLSSDEMSQTDRRAAEILARALAKDAIVRVRRALSMTVRNAQHLPLDIGLIIAHDVDSVACPFLAVTDIFSDEDWSQLLLTISRGARATVAKRSPMQEVVAKGLSGVGDSVVAENLIENSAVPMTKAVCQTLINRFETEVGVLDKLALRDDLITDIAVQLTGRVSDAVRDKLSRTYKIPGSFDPVVEEAAIGAIVVLLKDTSEEDLMVVVQTLQAENNFSSKF